MPEIMIDGVGYDTDSSDVCQDYEGRYILQLDAVVCDECRKYVHEAHAISCGSEEFCPECYETVTVPCEVCGERDFEDNMRSISSRSWVCSTCYRREMYYCELCGEDFWLSDPCDCASDFEPDYERRNYENIHNYSYVPRLVFRSVESLERVNTKTRFIGFELEAENRSSNTYNNDEVAKKVCSISDNLGSLFYCKEDGSLSYGFESVSHPFTFLYYKKNKALIDKLLTTLIGMGMRSYTPGTCGLHVHVSKGSFSRWDIYKIMRFFHDNSKYISILSQRGGSTGFCKKNNNECIKETAWDKTNHDKYTEVNLVNSRTVEFRFFRGTTKKESFHKAIEFIFSFLDFVQVHSLSQMTTKDYHDYLHSRSDTFKNLISFLINKELF